MSEPNHSRHGHSHRTGIGHHHVAEGHHHGHHHHKHPQHHRHHHHHHHGAGTHGHGSPAGQGHNYGTLKTPKFTGDANFPHLQGKIAGVLPALLNIVEKAAETLGQSLTITDGLRAKNAGYGAPNSAHKSGRAVDIRIRDLSTHQRTELIDTVNKGLE